MSAYNIIAASNESTVVAEYTPESSRSDSFQSEAALEKEFIRLLTTQVQAKRHHPPPDRGGDPGLRPDHLLG